MLNPFRLVSLLAVLALLIGCTSPAGTVTGETETTALEEETPTYDERDPTEEGLASDPYTSPVVEESEAPAPVATPTPAPTELVAYFTKQDTSGLLFWKKITIAGEVYNPTATTRSGVLKVEFSKNGKVVETRGRTISSLRAGETYAFEYKSNESADDAQLIITTD